MERRRFAGALGAFLLAGPLIGFGRHSRAQTAPEPVVPAPDRPGALPVLRVMKSRLCGCCDAWVAHMRAAGFEAEVSDLEQDELDSLKRRLGIGPALASCHTAAIAGYFVEGHVPAGDVLRLLGEMPDAAGLAVPGMPVGSPGMEMGDLREPFDTLLVGRDGGVTVFASHG